MILSKGSSAHFHHAKSFVNLQHFECSSSRFPIQNSNLFCLDGSKIISEQSRCASFNWNIRLYRLLSHHSRSGVILCKISSRTAFIVPVLERVIEHSVSCLLSHVDLNKKTNSKWMLKCVFYLRTLYVLMFNPKLHWRDKKRTKKDHLNVDRNRKEQHFHCKKSYYVWCFIQIKICISSSILKIKSIPIL